MQNTEDKLELKLNFNYINNDEFDFLTMLSRINLDKAREESILSGNGFIIRTPNQNIKKALREDDGIFSSRFGQSLQDVNLFVDRYRCKCGSLTGRITNGLVCPICGEKVRFVDDNFDYFAWIVLKDPYYVIHPNLYRTISSIIPKDVLDNIIKPIDEHDKDGFKRIAAKYKDEPFKGIGILEFKNRFKEILDYYFKKSPNKIDYYNDIMDNIDSVFTQSIPVYTTHLRPTKVDGENLYFEGTNAIYVMMTRLQAKINKDDIAIAKKSKPKNRLLYDLHCKYMELYTEIINIMSGKKGLFRGLIGGRYNFTARSVIIPDPTLRIDQCKLSYYAGLELFQQSIINILKKTYNITYNAAYTIWDKSQTDINPTILSIMKGLIANSKNGIPVLINRNPTINFGSILQMFAIDITEDYTLSLPLQILPLLAADFDGDSLNILYIINKRFFEACNRILNPRNNMYISKNDGKFNNDVNHQKDLIINATQLMDMHRCVYSKEQLDKIALAKTLE